MYSAENGCCGDGDRLVASLALVLVEEVCTDINVGDISSFSS